LQLAGGDRAAREPWRMAAAALALAERGHEIVAKFAHERGAPLVAEMLARNVNAPPTSSMGRWFDAAAGMLGVCSRMSFEGQAPMLLEGLAARHGPVDPEPALFAISDANELDLTPCVLHLGTEHNAERGAALFHATLVAALAEWVARAAQSRNVATVACGGGCFLNAILSRGLRAALATRGIAMLEASAVPPNDGGLSLGQAWVALRAAGEI
jgi:hydrogenase maturation protein HypF